MLTRPTGARGRTEVGASGRHWLRIYARTRTSMPIRSGARDAAAKCPTMIRAQCVGPGWRSYQQVLCAASERRAVQSADRRGLAGVDPAAAGRSIEDVDRRLHVLVLVRRIAPLRPVGASRRGTPRASRPRCAAAGTPAGRSRGSGSRRRPSARACGMSARRTPAGNRRPATRARSSPRRSRSPSIHGAPISSNGRVVPRPSDSIVPSNSTAPG